MNRSKLALIIIGALAALALLVVALAFTSGVQTWAVRRALAGQPGLKAEVGQVSAGLSSAELRDVRIEQDGTIVVAKEISATYSATDYLFGHKINVGRVVVRGAEIDARHPTAKAPAPAPSAALAPFAGILNAVRLPGEVRFGSLEVEAKVLLPGDQVAALNVTGGGVAPGEFATIKWKATFADPRKGAALVTAQASGEIKLRTTTDLRIDNVEVTGDAAATGPGLPSDHVKLELKLAQATAAAGETIAARVSLVRGATVEPLFAADVAYAAGKPALSGTWKLTVRSDQFAAVLAGLGLPEVALAGDGSFTYNVDSGAATTTGALTGKISQLAKLAPELGAIGDLQVRAAFDGGSSKETAQLGKFEFEVAAADGRKLVTVAAQQKLAFNFKDKRVTPERPGTELARVSLIGVPLAWAQPVVKPRVIAGGDISGVFVVNAELDGSRVAARAVEPLTIRGATLREGEKTLVDRLTLTVSPSVDYTAAKIVADAPKFSVSTPDGDTINGSLSAEVVTGAKPATAFAAQLQGRLAALVKPYLPAEIGPLAVAINVKGRLEGNALQVSTLSIKADRETGSATLLAIEALQPLAIDLTSQKVQAPDAAKPAARVRWGEVPLAWAQSYVANSKLDGLFAAGSLEVTLVGADAIAIRALEPIAAHGASVALSGQQWLTGADLTTDLNATWKAGTLSADIQHLDLHQGKISVLTAAFTGEATPGKSLHASGHGSVSADFAALAQQPALAAQLPLVRGTVSVKFDGAMAEGVHGKLDIVADNLVARQGALPLGKMELSVDANLDADNAGSVRVPLVITKDGRRSDVLLDGKVGMKPGAISFNGRVTSTQLVVDDLQAFNALSPQPPVPAPQVANRPVSSAPPVTNRPVATAPAAAGAPGVTKTGTPVRDTTPVWAGFSGRIDLDVKSVKQGTGTTLQDLKGAFAVSADRLTIENVGGQLNGNPFKVATILSFDVKQAQPYTLVGSLEVPGFDVGAFLRKADPSTPPALETTVTVTSKFNGTAANLPEFADRLTGQFDFKGTKGVLRALNKKAETTSTALNIAGALTGLLGGGNKIAEKASEALAGAADLAAALKDIQFDSITIQAERGADGIARVKSLELLAPALRLTGSGHVDQKPGTDLGNSPLNLELQLAAKSTIANALNKAHQLSGKTDDKGYYLMQTPFTLGGTLAKPDSSEFWKKLTVNTGAGFLR